MNRINWLATVAVVSAPLIVLDVSGAATEEELLALRKELAEIKNDLAEIKEIISSAFRGQERAPSAAFVNVAGKPSLGRDDAPVTLVEFSDYQCPFCKRHFSTVYTILKKDYIDTGKLRYVFRDFPIASLHPQAQKAHEAAHCAEEQNKYWDMHDTLFENATELSIIALKVYATKIGLNEDQFNACIQSGKHAGTIDKEIAEGIRIGVNGTPAFFIGLSESGGKITGIRISGAQPLGRFTRVIDDLLAGSRAGKTNREK